MRAVAHVMDLVVAEHRVVRDVDIDAVARKADVVADDLRAAAVVELDAVAALRGQQVALAGDQIAAGCGRRSPFAARCRTGCRPGSLLRTTTRSAAGLDVDAGVLRVRGRRRCRGR